MSLPLFSRRMAWGLGCVTLVSLLTFLAIQLAPTEPSTQQRVGSDVFSRSALGHRAAVDFLRAMSIDVTVSRYDTHKRSLGKTLLILEPTVVSPQGSDGQSLRRLLEGPSAVLVTLPKWRADFESSERPGHVGAVSLRSVEEVQRVLEALGVETVVQRPKTLSGWTGDNPRDKPTLLKAQLMANRGLVPMVWYEEGVLLGQVPDTSIFVLSDPDVLSTHGLARGLNPSFFLSVVEEVGTASGLVVDETLHGYDRVPGLVDELTSFPLVLACLQAGLCLLVILWGGLRRFGVPEPTPGGLLPGKRFLVRNAADLLQTAGHAQAALRRYYVEALNSAAETLHAPAQDRDARLQWLADNGARRQVSEDIVRLDREIRKLRPSSTRSGRHARHIVELARRIHRWKGEITDGHHRSH